MFLSMVFLNGVIHVPNATERVIRPNKSRCCGVYHMEKVDVHWSNIGTSRRVDTSYDAPIDPSCGEGGGSDSALF